MAIQLSIQYCCFDRIYSAQYGVCVYSAAKNTTLFFASSVNCASELEYQIVGAQYDLQANSINSEYVNITRSKAQYCAGIEYRRASEGVFQQQTFTEMYCGFGTSFTNMGNGLNITIQNCNFFNNTVQKHSSATDNILPALVHVKSDNIELTSFYFIKNIYNDGATFVGYEAGQTKTFLITLTNCYADCDTLLPSDHVSYTSCHFTADIKTTMKMDQLNLGNCQGSKTPPLWIIASSEFSESVYFSHSNSFTRSFTFSKSNSFSSSYKFTRSDVFEATNHFSSSHVFTKSKSFTPSFKFTQSNSFTSSNSFTQSVNFTSSNPFTKSNTFEVRPPDNLIVETTKESSKLPMIAGVVAGLVALLAVAIIIIIVRKKKSSIKLEHVEPETVEQENTAVVNSNPLFNEMNNDDPFREDFAGTVL